MPIPRKRTELPQFPDSRSFLAGTSTVREGSREELVHLIESWLQDSSGLDEKIWPILEQDLAATRD